MKRPRLGWLDLWPMGMATIYVAYGLYLLAVGPLETIVTPDDGSVTVHEPTSTGLLLLVVGGLVLGGLWVRRDRISWAGGAFALLIGVAFLFSLSAVLVPMAVLLLAALALRRQVMRRQTLRR